MCRVHALGINNCSHNPRSVVKIKPFVLKPSNQNESPKFLKPEECLNRNWTLDIPHLNFTSPKENIAEIVDSIDSTLHFSYADACGHHSATIFLIWNIILSIAVGYILFYRSSLAAIPAATVPVRAERKNDTEHDIYLSLMCIGLVLFILYITGKICLIIIIVIKER